MRFRATAWILLSVFLHARAKPGQYISNDDVPVWLNQLGPYNNPQETYSYYRLPFCKPDRTLKLQPSKSMPNLGELMSGADYVNSGILIQYKTQQASTRLCDKVLNAAEAKQFDAAIKRQYWYQLEIDDLPVWGMVGEVDSEDDEQPNPRKPEAFQGTTYVYTHKSFSLAYNGDRIIYVNLTSENPVLVTDGSILKFTYSVEWTETTDSYATRFTRYLDLDFFQHQIHWFSIFNSFMMVLFLCGIVALILMRTLRNDYAKYNLDDNDLAAAVTEDSGWKLVHGDVFRAPTALVLFSSFVGTGTQIAVMVVILIFMALAGHFYMDRGATTKYAIMCYALTSIINGFCGAQHYKTYSSQQQRTNTPDQWKLVMVVSSVLFPSVCLFMVIVLGLVSMSYSQLLTVPTGTMLLLMILWLLVCVPLIVIGSILGRMCSATNPASAFPCRVAALARPIVAGRWFQRPAFLIAASGVLPFGSIFIEMYFIFSSFWNYKFYYVYGFMMLVYCILVVVLLCVTIVCTYFLLNSEDHRWQWTSFLAAGSTAVYVYCYSIYYFFMKTNMQGLLQTIFYFGYMAVFCFGFFLVCGTIGHFGSSCFVQRIYRNIKID